MQAPPAREDWVQAPPTREDRLPALPGGARWDAPTVGKNEAHLRCMKNEAGLPPYEARLRRTEDKRVRFALC